MRRVKPDLLAALYEFARGVDQRQEGNRPALRRVLLSSLPGSAVTAVKISGVQHEFSTLPGVQEDIVDLLLNIKQLRVKVHGAEPVTFHLKASGELEVTAAAIAATSGVSILNPELHLATLTDKKAKLEIEFIAQSGRGFVPVEARDKEKLDLGTIALDSIYTPIRRVGYDVESVRVGQMTNYERVTLDVESDGSLTPLEAVQMASSILIDHFRVLAGSMAEAAPAAAAEEAGEPVPEAADEGDAKANKKRGRPKKESSED